MDREKIRNKLNELHDSCIKDGYEQYRIKHQIKTEMFEDYRRKLIALDTIGQHLLDTYSNATGEINIMKWNLVKRLRSLFHAILDIIEVNQDYNVAQTINRMIADRLSIIELFFEEKNELIVRLRFYLYVLDDLTTEKEIFQKAIDNKSSEEEDKKQLEAEIDKINDDLSWYEGKVGTIKDQLSNYIISDKVLEKHWWRFKVEGAEIKGKYSYADLYQKLFSCDADMFSTIISSLSSNVHGLLSSNMGNSISETTAHAAINVSRHLLASYFDAMCTIYPDERTFIIAFLKERTQETINTDSINRGF